MRVFAKIWKELANLQNLILQGGGKGLTHFKSQIISDQKTTFRRPLHGTV